MVRSPSKKLWDNPGPDQGWSWIVLSSAWFMAATTFGITTIGGAGILFTEFIRVYDLSREDAMWPFSVLGITQSMVGLLGGFLADTCSMRGLLIFSTALCSLSLILCYWSTGILYVALVFGMPFGVGNGIIHSILGAYICGYFVKHQATATGFYLSSTPLAGFILPIVMSKLIEEYGLRGTMLVMGGFMLNMMVAAILLRPRTPTHFPVLKSKEDELLELNDKPKNLLVKKATPTFKQMVILSLKRYKVVIADPMFYVVTIHAIVCVNIITTMALTLTDFVMDAGISKSTGVTLLSIFAIADLVGRLFSGLVSDRGYMKRKNVAVLSMLTMGVCLYIVGVSRKVPVIGTIVIFMGMAEGSANILINVLYREYMGLSRLPISLSLRIFVVGLASILRPFFIGLFRDTLGSYIYFYYLLGGASIASGCLWLLEPLITCHKAPKESAFPSEIDLEE